MPAAGAADRDRQIALAFAARSAAAAARASRQSWSKKGRKIRIRLDVCGDRGVAPGQRLQFGDIMRIVEKAHVEDQIGIARQAVAIRERGDENAKTAGRSWQMAVQQPFQIGSAQVGRIDHKISAVAQGRNHSALEPDAVRYGPLAGEGMGPARLGIAPLQRFVVTIEEQHPELEARPADYRVEGFEHALDSKAPDGKAPGA